MFVHKDKVNELLGGFQNNVIEGLEDKHEFLNSLLEEDDWSLTIKGHALIESVITELIVEKTNEEKLKPIIERLPLHEGQTSKVKILKIYALISEEESLFIRKLSELRNALVHKVENINFLFSKHVNDLDKNQTKSWVKALTWYAKDQETKNAYSKVSIENPKIAIWLAILMFVSHYVVQIEKEKSINYTAKVADETTKEIIEELGLVGTLTENKKPT